MTQLKLSAKGLFNQKENEFNMITQMYTKEERKTNGIFYTPKFLSDYLAKKVLMYYNDEKKIRNIIDPACGDSILLQSLAEEILSSNKKPLINNFFGIDKDLNAILNSKKKFSNGNLKSFENTFVNADALFPINGVSTEAGWSNLLSTKLKIKNGFDITLSNPPWGSALNGYNSSILVENFDLAKGQFDVFDLFVEVILKNLNTGGVYGLILPDSVFGQEQARLRSMLSHNTTINLIARLGEKIFPEINRACVIIIGKNNKAPDNHFVDCFRLTPDSRNKIMSKHYSLMEIEKELVHKVLQSRFIKNDNCVFNIDLKVEEQKIFNKILKNTTVLKEFVNNTRGAEISKKGWVCQCSNCKHWMPYPKSKEPRCTNCNESLNIVSLNKEKIILNHNGYGNFKLKVGEDLFRFTSASKSWINTLKEGINYKNFNIYEGDKILVRKTGVGITASIDYENSITNQVVYILKLKKIFINKLSLEFILAVLNSRIMTYFLIKTYGENEWKSHPYLTQTMLINLPFPEIDFRSKEDKKLISSVTKIVKSEVTNSQEKNISKKNDLYIERVIAHFFNLNLKDYKEIFNTLNSSGQLLPIKRLLNCSTKEIFNINGI